MGEEKQSVLFRDNKIFTRSNKLRYSWFKGEIDMRFEKPKKYECRKCGYPCKLIVYYEPITCPAGSGTGMAERPNWKEVKHFKRNDW